MDLIDFLIGLTVMNAMPHFVLGIWKGRMLSGFGIGDRKNILYGLSNFVISISLFLYKYGIDGLLGNSLYLGALFTLILYFILGQFLYRTFKTA